MFGEGMFLVLGAGIVIMAIGTAIAFSLDH